jgi:hypothetical protein
MAIQKQQKLLLPQGRDYRELNYSYRFSTRHGLLTTI